MPGLSDARQEPVRSGDAVQRTGTVGGIACSEVKLEREPELPSIRWAVLPSTELYARRVASLRSSADCAAAPNRPAAAGR
jgi:hypothetical protein